MVRYTTLSISPETSEVIDDLVGEVDELDSKAHCVREMIRLYAEEHNTLEDEVEELL